MIHLALTIVSALFLICVFSVVIYIFILIFHAIFSSVGSWIKEEYIALVENIKDIGVIIKTLTYKYFGVKR